MLELARAPREQKAKLRESVQQDSIFHQILILSHMSLNPTKAHTIGSLCEELESSHHDGLIVHFNIFLLMERGKIKRTQQSPEIRLTIS